MLVLFADGPDGPDLLFIQRSKGLRLHAGQTASRRSSTPRTRGRWLRLREAARKRVSTLVTSIVATPPELFIPPTGVRVVAVLAWCRRPRAVAPVDPGEVAAVERISVSELADPAGRLMLHRPSGIILPAFRVRGMLIWTIANLNNALLLVTSNKSEAAVGYTTMDGDSSGGRRIAKPRPAVHHHHCAILASSVPADAGSPRPPCITDLSGRRSQDYAVEQQGRS